jgi:hypothetical protein
MQHSVMFVHDGQLQQAVIKKMNKNGTIPFNVFMTELMNSDDYTITPKTF